MYFQKALNIFFSLFNFQKNIFLYFLIIFLAGIPFFIYGKSTIISPYGKYGEMTPEIFFSTWLPSNGGIFAFLSNPFDAFLWIALKILPEWFIVQFSLFFITSIALFSSFFLFNFLFKNKKLSFLLSFIYSYSIYSQFIITSWPSAGSIVFALLPFFVWRFLSFSEKKNVIREVCILSLPTFLLVGVNLTFLIYLFLFCFIISICNFLINFSQITFLKIFFLYCFWIIFFVLINSSFFLSFLSEYLYQSDFVEESLSSETVTWKSSTNSLHELWREMGSVNFYYNYINYSYPNAQIFINNNFFIFLSYGLPIFALSSILFLKRTTIFWKNFLIILLVILSGSFFMAMGVFESSPTKFFYKYLSKNIPYFSIFRDSFKSMFIIHFIYIILIGFFLFTFKQKNIIKYVIFSSILFISTLILSFQFWQGSFLKNQMISIPGYWEEMADFYKNDNRNYNILFMPEMYFTVYNFTSYRAKFVDFYRPLLNWCVIANIDVSPFPDSNKAFHLLYDSYKDISFSRLMGMYGIGYILIQYDADYKVYKSMDPYRIEMEINKNGIINNRIF